MNDLMTVREVAEAMRLTPRGVRQMIADGRLPAVRYAGTRQALVRRADVTARLRRVHAH
ncbi:helix-turn-helix domain-containing protein [Gordonia sp. UBA7599]|jgi:excisionase family DNA binding protein|uniref:helix-turn-helix domain-containing protein n=1 Tax=unclassified Gordonia (in: high G+C Gram-positive bacteria) TaxID=2657482 RepID=UPI0025BE546A|nr:helix-turn-helix domain-containing protein [Gordonia sp. UBA7599]HNP58820.1 helix-turn-helix domain-containing protein [Gordonia sp. (in: high G+C Gram-positive bacteria)]